MDQNKNTNQNSNTENSANTQNNKMDSDIIQGNYIKRKVYPGIYTR